MHTTGIHASFQGYDFIACSQRSAVTRAIELPNSCARAIRISTWALCALVGPSSSRERANVSMSISGGSSRLTSGLASSGIELPDQNSLDRWSHAWLLCPASQVYVPMENRFRLFAVISENRYERMMSIVPGTYLRSREYYGV